jgi:uncharacterized protein YjbI with pentapeptide repeats
LLVGVLSACGSSDSGEDGEREAAAGTEKCDAPPAWDVDWSGCDKSGARLRSANLYRANLTDANLSGADLSGADLHRASLRYARLEAANLGGANLSGANLNRALCDSTTRWPDGTKGHGTTCPPTN